MKKGRAKKFMANPTPYYVEFTSMPAVRGLILKTNELLISRASSSVDFRDVEASQTPNELKDGGDSTSPPPYIAELNSRISLINKNLVAIDGNMKDRFGSSLSTIEGKLSALECNIQTQLSNMQESLAKSASSDKATYADVVSNNSDPWKEYKAEMDNKLDRILLKSSTIEEACYSVRDRTLWFSGKFSEDDRQDADGVKDLILAALHGSDSQTSLCDIDEMLVMNTLFKDNKWRALVRFSSLSIKKNIWKDRFLLGKNYRIFVDVNLVKTEQARKDKMLKLLYEFNANASERVRYLRGATGIIFLDNLYLFGSGKSVETLKQVLGNIADGKVTPQKVKGS
uniref:Uncharacterized protein n=1 Tax=Fibrocapsa japonica TaxID=94617 RepID=A0A7S2USD2_9STRA